MVVLPEIFTLGQCSSFDWLAPFGAAPSQRPMVSSTNRPRTLHIAVEILRATEINGAERDPWLQVLLQELLLVLREGWAAPPQGTGLNARLYSRIEPAIRLVFESKAFIPVASAASACGMSRNVFASSFKHITGVSFATFALRYRLSAVAHELETGDAPLKALAKEWGFSDVSHLHKCFHHYAGISPAQYRRERQRQKTAEPGFMSADLY